MTYLLATYSDKTSLITAAKALSDLETQVYTAFDLEELSKIDKKEPIDFAPFGFMGAVAGGCLGYFMEYYLSVRDLPLNLGGRPVHTAIAFIPVTFECAVLAAGLSIVAAYIWSTKLPELNHPLFDSPEFLLSRENPFFIAIEARTAPETEKARERLRATSPLDIDTLNGVRS